MPTYEYVCGGSGRRFEKFQSVSEKPLRTCPDCGGPVRRLIGAGGAVIFKGSGFYATDYGRGSGSTTRCAHPGVVRMAADTVCLRIIQAPRDAYKGEPWPVSPPPRSIAVADTKYHLGTSDPAKIHLVKLGWKDGVLV